MSSDYSLSMSGASLRRPESLITARLYLENRDWKETRRQIIDDDLYQLNAVSSRKRISGELVKRLATLTDQEISFLVDAYGDDQSAMFWVAICRTYQFVSDLSVNVIVDRYSRSIPEYTVGAFEQFFDEQSAVHPELGKLSKLGHDKMRNTVFRLLVECGLVSQQGTQQHGKITPLYISEPFRAALDPERAQQDIALFPGVTL